MSPEALVFPEAETASVALGRMRANWPDILDRAEADIEQGFFALLGCDAPDPGLLVLSEAQAAGNWYFVGDLHGDFLAWHTLFAEASRDPDFRLCFLGDLIDRGPHHVECLAAILEAAARFPGRIIWILGNHEDGVEIGASEDDGQPRYVSRVAPAEFVDWLNAGQARLDRSRADRTVRLLSRICSRLPRAVAFPDGLLATHGGIPLADRWPLLTSLAAFGDPQIRADFTWTRAASAPIRLGWRYAPEKRRRSSDFEFGWRDLEGFTNAVAPMLRVRRVVRGHDHVAGGAERLKGYETIPVLTLTGFGFDHITNDPARYRQSLTLGRASPGALPEIIEVPVPQDQYEAIYGAPPDAPIAGDVA